MNFTPNSGKWGESWNELSTDSRYALRYATDAFVALFIPGVWARAEEIGSRPTREAAQALCEKHSLKPLTIKRIQYLVTGV